MLFCFAFVVISFSLRPQVEETRVLVKSDRLVRTGWTGAAGPLARATGCSITSGFVAADMIASRSAARIAPRGERQKAGEAADIEQHFQPDGHGTHPTSGRRVLTHRL